jgi:hypothetical protein
MDGSVGGRTSGNRGVTDVYRFHLETGGEDLGLIPTSGITPEKPNSPYSPLRPYKGLNRLAGLG